MNKITYADSEVQAYHFTTQSLFVGHTYYKNIRWQVIDTPGILDRTLEQRNIIEMQTITALAHLDACILYFIDVSENCGYSISQQVSLFDSIRPLFKNKPLVIIANKTDLRAYNDLPEKDRKCIEDVAKEHQTYLIQMSNTTGNGVFDVKSKACDILLKYREVTNHGASTKDITGLDKIYIAQPTQIRDNRKRLPNIPQSFIEEKNNKITEEKNEKVEEEKFLREDTINTLEKKITNNKVKEIIEANGGVGVYYFPQREEFKLENPDWKYDVWPEIMDGKNVYDFVDKDILKKVEALEKEEELINNKELDLEDDDNMKDDDGEESSELSDDLIEAHEKLMKNVKTIKERHKMVKKSRIPVRFKFMEEVRPDLKAKAEKVKLLSQKLRREQKDKMRNSLKKEAGVIEEDQKVEEDDEMDIDEENQNTKKRKKVSEKESVKVKQEKNKIVQRLQKKIQKKFDKNLQINETDRRIGDKKPRFFNSGKRGIGKTDWR